MRVIRLNVKPFVEAKLKVIAGEWGISDKDFVLDLYSLVRLKGHGLPDTERSEAMAKYAGAKNAGVSELTAKIIIRKRTQVFKKFVLTAYFKAAVMLYDPVKATERLLSTFRKMYYIGRKSQCMNCMYHPDCTFGKEFGSKVNDITSVCDPDYKNKVHSSCPLLPTFDAYGILNEGVDKMMSMQNSTEAEVTMAKKTQDDLSGVEALVESKDKGIPDADLEEDGNTEFFDPDHFGKNASFGSGVRTDEGGAGSGSSFYMGQGEKLTKAVENTILNLSKQSLDIFDLSRTLDLELESKKKGKFSPVEEVAKDNKDDKIKSLSELNKVKAVEHGLPDEVYDAKEERKSLVKRQELKRQEKKQLLYLLIDNSGSMTTSLNVNKHMVLNRGLFASVFACALVKRVIADGGIIFVRMFTGCCGPLHSAYTKEEQEVVLNMLGREGYNGGSTNIPRAIETALQDINTGVADKIAKAEVLLITDCCDNVSKYNVKRELDKGSAALHVLDVSGTTSYSSVSAQKVLQSLATKYYKADEKAVNLKDVLKLV